MNAEEQQRYLGNLDRRCLTARVRGGEHVAAALRLEDRDLLSEILHDSHAEATFRTKAAQWLAYLDDADAIDALVGWLEQGDPASWPRGLETNHIPPLARSGRLVQAVLSRLDPAHPQWAQFLQIAGMQQIAEAGPRLEEILLAGQAVPEIHRVAFWVSQHNRSLEMLEATLRYLDPSLMVPIRMQPWSVLGAFGVAEPQRKRILEFLRGYGEPPGEYGWNFNYESKLCSLGDHSNLAEIEQLFTTAKRFNGSAVDALVRVQGRDAAPRLLTLLGDAQWSSQAVRAIGTTLAGSEDPAAIAALGALTGDDSRLPLVLEALLKIGGAAARELVGQHIRRIPKMDRQALWWDYLELKLEVFAQTMISLGATAVRAPAECRAANPGRPDNQLVHSVLGAHLFSIDSESDEVPCPHDRLLERLAGQLREMGFLLNAIGQSATGPDEDDNCQYEIWFEFDGIHHAFPAETNGDWYDMAAVMTQLQAGIERSRPEWSVFLLETGDQILQFLVMPRKLRMVLPGFGIPFVER